MVIRSSVKDHMALIVENQYASFNLNTKHRRGRLDRSAIQILGCAVVRLAGHRNGPNVPTSMPVHTVYSKNRRLSASFVH